MDELLHLLVGDWAVYTQQTRWVFQRRQQGQVTRMRKANERTLQQFGKMVEWCRARSIEPRLWLYFLFSVRNWFAPPRFDDGSLMSESAIEKYRRFGSRGDRLGFFRRRMGASARESVGGTYDPNRDLAPSVESLKAHYNASGDHQRCYEETLLKTLGYHPKSQTCRACPISGQCAVGLEAAVAFPILSLRLGRITSADAEAIATGAA